MNTHGNAGLTPAQMRQLRMAQKVADNHRAEIDATRAAQKVADNHRAEIDATRAAQKTADTHGGEIATARAAAKTFTVPLEDPMPDVGTERAVDSAIQAMSDGATAALTPVADEISRSVFRQMKPAWDGIVGSNRTSLFTSPTLIPQYKLDLWGDFTPNLVERMKLDILGDKFRPQTPFVMPSAFGGGSRVLGNDLGSPITQLAETLLPKLDLGWTGPKLDLGWRVPKLDFLPSMLDSFPMTSAVPGWEAVLPRIDLAAFTQVHDVASVLNGFRRPDLVHDVFAGMPQISAFENLQSTITSLFESWRTLAGFGHGLAGTALGAALSARDAVLEGKTEVVEEFAENWLRIKKVTAEVLDAVSAALLDDTWLEAAARKAVNVIHDLFDKRYRRSHRPVWETQIGGRSVDSANRMIRQPSGDVLEVVNLEPAPEPGANEWQLSHPVAKLAFAKFSPDEQRVVQAKFSSPEPGMTWEMAADDCGFPPAMGEKVRRKFNRVRPQVLAAS